MLADSKPPLTEVSRRDAEAKLVECRHKFLGFLRKRLNSPQEAEDLFQDFCVKVLRHHDSIKNGARLEAWLGITLRHALTDHYRRRTSRNRGAEAYAIEAGILLQETDAHDEPACSCIAAALAKLDPAQAELLTRLDLQEEPRKAVAADLGVSLNALGVRAHRARAALKKQIADICPVCGTGGFMHCDCDPVRAMRGLTVPSQPEPAAGM